MFGAGRSAYSGKGQQGYFRAWKEVACNLLKGGMQLCCMKERVRKIASVDFVSHKIVSEAHPQPPDLRKEQHNLWL